MTRIVIIVVTAVVAFGGGFLGMLMTMPNVAPDKVAAADSTAAPVEVVVEVPDTLISATEPVVVPPSERVVVLEDSLRDALAEMEALNAEIERLRSAKESSEAYALSLAELSATLPKLERDDLAAILERLDITALDRLYQAATARNRTTILQALSPERGARFVQRIVDPNSDILPLPSQP